MSNPKLKNIVEGFIFASDKALGVEQILKMFPEVERPQKEEIIFALEELQSDFSSHGVELKKVSTGYRFQVREEYTQWVSRLWEERPHKYTRALLETLALIVYRQPITRGEIEEIRGVSVSSNIVRTLQEREWVKVVGNRDVPGRPALLASTKEFLDYFNLESLEDLPPLSEIKDLDSIATELDPEQNAALISAIRDMQEAQKSSDIDGGVNASNEKDASEKVESEHTKPENTEPSKTMSGNKTAESVEHIAAEIERAIEVESQIEVAEETMETELIEQTQHEEEFLQQSNAQDEVKNERVEDQLDESSTQNQDGKVGEV